MRNNLIHCGLNIYLEEYQKETLSGNIYTDYKIINMEIER
jgi:hypothetical protein